MLADRLSVFRAMLNRPWVRRVGLIWGFWATYDLIVAQWLPLSWAEKMPRAYELLSITSGLLPLSGWFIIGLLLVVAACVEYVWRLERPTPIDSMEAAKQRPLRYAKGKLEELVQSAKEMESLALGRDLEKADAIIRRFQSISRDFMRDDTVHSMIVEFYNPVLQSYWLHTAKLSRNEDVDQSEKVNAMTKALNASQQLQDFLSPHLIYEDK